MCLFLQMATDMVQHGNLERMFQFSPEKHADVVAQWLGRWTCDSEGRGFDSRPCAFG